MHSGTGMDFVSHPETDLMSVIEGMKTDTAKQHVGENILFRLPIKSLVRLRCVSKAMYHGVTSSEFLHNYLKHCQANNNTSNLNFMLPARYGRLQSLSYSSVTPDDLGVGILTPIDQPLFDVNKQQKCHILGSCDGLLLVVVITGFNHPIIYLWNPTTGEHKILPQRKTGEYKSPCGIVYGFGRDPTSYNNYKVLYLDTITGESDLMEFQVYLYTTQTDSWKTLPNIPFCYMGCDEPPYGMTLVNSNLIHLAEKDIEDLDAPKSDFLSFDLKDDKFRVLPMIPDCHCLSGCVMSLTSLNDKFYLLLGDYEKYSFCLRMLENMGLKEERWTNVCCIDNPGQGLDIPLLLDSPLCLFEDGHILFTAVPRWTQTSIPRYSCIICCGNKRAKILKRFDPVFDPPLCSTPVMYVESLISPNAGCIY